MKGFAATRPLYFPQSSLLSGVLKMVQFPGQKKKCKSSLSHNPAAITRGTKEPLTSPDGRERRHRVIPTAQNNPLTHKYQPASEYQI